MPKYVNYKSEAGYGLSVGHKTPDGCRGIAIARGKWRRRRNTVGERKRWRKERREKRSGVSERTDAEADGHGSEG